MKKKIIGIDIDGVITDENHLNDNIWHDALCKFMGCKLERVKESYYFTEAYDLPLEVIEKFMEEHTEKIMSMVKPMEGARETIEKLRNNGFEIHLITARNPTLVDLTSEWLEKYKIPFTSLTHEENKAPLALDKGIELFVEDNAFNALQLITEGIHVILLEKYHNVHIKDNKEIIRVNTWEEIKDNIFNYYKLD
ncbi:MAG: 5' nucleotidase, NT5C type [Bacillota bacterium]